MYVDETAAETHGNEETSGIGSLTDDEFEDLELYLDFNIFDSISDFCSKPQKSSIGCEPDGN